MVNLIYIFWMYVILFAVIGAMRGWAKELLVSFSMILALALNYLLRKYIPMVSNLLVDEVSLFWVRSLITIGLVYFGYQTIGNLSAFSGKARKEKLQDGLLGSVMGGLNGYLIVGTLWFYLHDAVYPFDEIFVVPTDLFTEMNTLMLSMPPSLLVEPYIYFAVIIAFIFIIVVYV